MIGRRVIIALAMLVGYLGGALADSKNASAKEVFPVSAAEREAIQKEVYRLPLPTRMRAHTALFFKAPRHRASTWEGALWLSLPQTATFEAVDEMAHTLFYLRYAGEDGWLLQSGDHEESVRLPFKGRDLVMFALGRPPNLPEDLTHFPIKDADPLQASKQLPIVVSGEGASWTFSPDHRPMAYQSPSPSSYVVEWRGWQRFGVYLYPKEVEIRDVKGRYKIRWVIYDADLL